MTPATLSTTVAATGLAFPEGPRWHDGRLWFTDQHARAIMTLDDAGALTTEAATTDLPGGLGWLPDGTLVVVYMTERRLMKVDADGITPYADLSAFAPWHCNDMVADAAGRIYTGNFGFDLHGGEPPRPGDLLLVDVDGEVEVFAPGLVFANGCAITPDGATLLVAETFAHRISAFDLDRRGRMASRRIWAQLGDTTPDGICLDAEGALWIASPGTGELLRVAAGGSLLARCTTTGTPYACMLGGGDGRTLYVCSAETDSPEDAPRLRSGRIEQTRVEVPGAGLP